MPINMDNKFLKGLSVAFDCVWLSFLWLLCSLPVITMGAATTAVLSVLLGVDQSSGSVTCCYFRSLKNNFKQTLVIQLILLAIAALLAVNVYICWCGIMPETVATVMRVMTVILIISYAVVYAVIYGIIAKLKVSIAQAFYNVLYLVVKKPLWVLSLVLLMLVGVLTILTLYAAAIFPLGIVFYLQSISFKKIYEDILPKSDDLEGSDS